MLQAEFDGWSGQETNAGSKAAGERGRKSRRSRSAFQVAPHLLPAHRFQHRHCQRRSLPRLPGVDSLPTGGAEEDPLSKVRVFHGKGCQQCNGSGFRGRLGIFELFEIDDQFRQMIIERRGSSLIRAAAIEKGMKTMLQDGLAKAFLGETTLDEVLRVAI